MILSINILELNDPIDQKERFEAQLKRKLHEINDDPLDPISNDAKQKIADLGDKTPKQEDHRLKA